VPYALGQAEWTVQYGCWPYQAEQHTWNKCVISENV